MSDCARCENLGEDWACVCGEYAYELGRLQALVRMHAAGVAEIGHDRLRREEASIEEACRRRAVIDATNQRGRAPVGRPS